LEGKSSSLENSFSSFIMPTNRKLKNHLLGKSFFPKPNITLKENVNCLKVGLLDEEKILALGKECYYSQHLLFKRWDPQNQSQTLSAVALVLQCPSYKGNFGM